MLRYPALVVLAMLVTVVATAAPQTTRPLTPARSDAEAHEPLTPLEPRQPRTEEDLDRLRAATLYSYGRVLLQRDDHARALRHFQRAWRYNPSSNSILAEIVPLAAALNRRAEAARYAVIAAESNPSDGRLLMALGAALAEQGDWPRALKLYQKALEREEKGQPGVGAVLLWMEMGRLYFLTEQFDKSAEVFAKAREAIEDDDKLVLPEEVRKRLLGDAERTYLVMAESFLLAERWDDAESAFHQAFADKPAALSVQLGRVAAARGDLDEAFDKLDSYFKTKSADAGEDAYELLEVVLTKKHADEANAKLLEKLEELHQADEENVPLGYFLAERLVNADRLDDAQRTLDPLMAKEATLDGYRLLAELQRRKKDTAALLRTLAKAVALSGDADSIRGSLDAILEDSALLDELLEQVSESMDPDSQPEDGVAVVAAHLALRAERWELVDQSIAAALRSKRPEPGTAAIELGLALFRGEQFERAAALFQEAIDQKLKPEIEGALHFYRSGALALGDKVDAAVEAAKAAAAANPESPDFEQRIAWILYRAGRYDEAEAAYVSLVEKYQSNHEPSVRGVLREARLVLSNICVQQERMADAEEWLEQVLDEFPEDIGALNDLGYLWVDQGKNLNRGLAMVQKAVESEPENRAYRDSLGWAYYRLGRYEDAVRELEKAAEGDDPDGVILDHLGDAYLKAGRQQEALDTWQRAIESFRSKEETKQLEATEKKLEQHRS